MILRFSASYIHEFRLRDKNTGKDMGVELNYLYLCLDRFEKSAEESKDPIDRFMYSLKNISGLNEMPRSFGDSEEMIELYEHSMMANLPTDTIYEIEAHRNMTTKNDILVALAEAREDEHAKALAEGEARGKTEVAKAMLAKDFPVDVIASVTGLDLEQISNL